MTLIQRENSSTDSKVWMREEIYAIRMWIDANPPDSFPGVFGSIENSCEFSYRRYPVQNVTGFP